MSYGMLRLRIGVPGWLQRLRFWLSRWVFRMRKRMSHRLQRVRVRMFGRVFWMRKRVPKHMQHMFKFLLVWMHWIMQRRMLRIVYGGWKYKSLSRRQ